jgi:hypothetical protein
LAAEAARLQAEAARHAAVGDGGRGRGAGRGHGVGFGNFGAAHKRPQFLGRARRVPIAGIAGFDGDADFGYWHDHQDGHRGGYYDRGGATFGHFGAFGHHQFASNEGHRECSTEVVYNPALASDLYSKKGISSFQ